MSSQDKTRFDYWKRMEFSKEDWQELKKHCDDLNIDFISSPFSNAAVDLLEEVGVHKYKIGSGELTNFLLLRKVCETGKRIIVSSGMSSFQELDRAIGFLNKQKASFSLLQCTTSYPTVPKNWGLNVISELRERYPELSIGFSDHSGTIAAGLAAVTLGAEILEFHLTFNKAMYGPDTSSSLSVDEAEILVSSIRLIEEAKNHPVDKSDSSFFKNVKSIFEKSLAVNKDLKKGHVISFDDLEAKKPKGYGLDAAVFENVIGRVLNKDLNKWDFLNDTDLDEDA